MSLVEYEVSDKIATITLNRPDVLNAMNYELLDAAIAATEEAASDDAVRAVILTGAGRAFCAGGDLKNISAKKDGPVQPLARDVAALRGRMRLSQLLHDMPKVTFAAINGPCAGAGMALACATDIRYCAESAVFNTAFMTAGLSGDFGLSWTLQRAVGPGKARELFLLAEKFRAGEAARIGLVSAVLPDSELMSFVRERALRAANLAPLTIAAAKANLNDALKLDFASHLDAEAERHTRTGRTADSKEAARAFLEKRIPVFQGK
jgi:2-(1,2-epoxy-1,2-dihydrophenyl)acetyl-CoA isomerase